MSSRIEFGFRVWVHPEGSDPPDIEVWFQGLEPTESGKWFASDWAYGRLSDEDFHDLFELDKTKHWQVVGKGTLHRQYGEYGECDENLDIIEYEKADVPESWYDREHLPSSTISEDQLIAFGKWCLEETKCAIVEGCFDLDAEAFADKSAELGLIEKAAYDPEKHHDSGDVPFDEGDVIYYWKDKL